MKLSPTQWKVVLAALAVVIVAGSALSAGYLVRSLAAEERAKVERWLSAQRFIYEMSDEEAAVCDITLYTDILQGNTTIPLLLVDARDSIIGSANFAPRREGDTGYLYRQLAALRAGGVAPIEGGGNRIYYLESRLLRALRFFPVVQMLLVGLFVALVYFSLSAVRRAEQNRVWVGMAKETAHQLGTPISAILAWVEYLRAEYEGNAELGEVADELARDVDRLQLVAERFNKIGSTPELTPAPVAEIVRDVFAYMQRRAPRRVAFAMEVDPACASARVAVNRPLFEWVLENLIRNALDAMDGRGALTLAARPFGKTGGQLELTVRDTGKGIPANKRRAVFKPGYTTKSRGWGLGLSLAKRIVEEYHGGKVYVKDSAVGKGTTFAVRLPAVV